MSMMKRWGEALSEALGRGGAITSWVTNVDGALRKLAAANMIVINPRQTPIAIIRSPGDPSVGIQPAEIQIVGLDLDDRCGPNDFREQLRHDLRELFVNVMDNREVAVTFSDECGDCGQQMDANEAGVLACANPRCVRNIPGDDEV